MQTELNQVLADLGVGQCVRFESHRHLAFFDVALSKSSSALNKLKSNAETIALRLKSKTVPLIKLVPQEGIVRLQVALKEAEPVKLTDLYSGESIPNMVFPLLLGEDEEGKKLWMEMNHCPHLLVAGGTGSGKSTLLHTLIANALYLHAMRVRNVWIYLSDPKRVEFNEYRDERLSDVICDVASSYKETVAQLEGLYEMMEERYQIMNTMRMRSVEENPTAFPIVFCIIDEVSDLMMQDKKGGKLQDLIIKLAQKGRACGIFLVLSTQRPSVNVITGLIKANFPGRIACKTASRKDSEVIIDRPGAETLLGRGDAVLQNMKYDNVRFQVAYTEPSEVVSNYCWLRGLSH